MRTQGVASYKKNPPVTTYTRIIITSMRFNSRQPKLFQFRQSPLYFSGALGKKGNPSFVRLIFALEKNS